MVLQSILISVVLGLSSNLDNIPVGLTCGSRKLRVPRLYTLLISLSSFAACWLAGTAGLTLGSHAPFGAAKWLGSAILVLVGLWMVLQFLFDKGQVSTFKSWHKSDSNSARNSLLSSERSFLFLTESIGFSEWMFIGLTQVMADLAIGFAVGFTHHNVLATAVSIGIGSVLLLNVSAWIGRQSMMRQTRTVSSRTSFVSGLLLIVIGLYL